MSSMALDNAGLFLNRITLLKTPILRIYFRCSSRKRYIQKPTADSLIESFSKKKFFNLTSG